MISNTLANFRRAQTAPQAAKQRGVTLMELIASLAVMAVVTVSALALYNAAVSSQRATQLTQEITALHGAAAQLWMGQGSFGASGDNLADTIVAAGRAPSTLRVTGTAPNRVLHHALGNIRFTSNVSTFHLALDGIPQNTCVELLSGVTTAQWAGVRVAATMAAVGAATLVPMPITPSDAAAACLSTSAIQFTGS